MSNELRLPGEKIANLEEYFSGKNTFDDGESVRSSVIGEIEFDKEERSVMVKRKILTSVPEIGDIVIGTVEVNFSSMFAVSIKYINNIKVNSSVECICSTKRLRQKSVALVKDIVRLKITNHANGTIHATIDKPDLGILFTKCKKCFGAVVQIRDAVKCKDCGWIDDRKLSSDFGKDNFIKLEI